MVEKDWMTILIGKNGEGPKNGQENFHVTKNSQKNY
jgi:hypothetical protein